MFFMVHFADSFDFALYFKWTKILEISHVSRTNFMFDIPLLYFSVLFTRVESQICSRPFFMILIRPT